MAPHLTSLLARVDPVGLAQACSAEPGNACKWVYERTGSVGLAEFVDWLTDVPLQILWILLIAWVVNQVAKRAIRRFGDRIAGMQEKGGHRFRSKAKPAFVDTGEVNLRAAARAQTITGVLRSVTSGFIGIFALIYILGVLGLNLGPLIAGAGVVGVALGFGAQSLVRDFLSGFFMLMEDHFGVGDVVDLGEATGTVEQVTLRVTRLRDQNGTVWHVPNGEIRRVGNKSQQWARAVIDIAVAPGADLERASAVIGEAAEAVWARDEAKPDVLGRPEVLGIEYLGPDAATIRVQGKTRPGAQWRVSRLLRVQIAEALAAEGIDLPPSTFVRQGAPLR
ncbi:MAG: putative small conductance mechanosensitive channel [Ilumatobacteraceae bacterium]|nr:putative small conductance mechanosensitive channel [Ilumatobacteraceae bacterium]